MAWIPTENNPYKWYKITKVTTLRGIPVTEFWVCIYQFYIQYMIFQIPPTEPQYDIEGNLIPYTGYPSPFKTVVSFKTFYSQEVAITDFQGNCLDNFSQPFITLPFEYEDGMIGVSNDINVFLAAKYEVALTDITE